MGERTNGQLYPTHLNPGSVTPTTLTAVTIHGDSLTANWAGNVASLATSLGRTVTARGNGGHTSKLIAARQGGQPMLVNVTGGSIPASGSVDVTLAFAAGVGTTGATSMPSAVGSYVGVLGNVAGTLAITSEGVGTFTRTTSGVATVISNGTPFTTGYSWRKALPIFWAGRNNFKLSGDATQIVSDIRAMMAWTQRADRALILSIPPWVGEENGTGVRNTLNSVNNAIRDAFPTAYVDTASMLRDQALIVEVGGTPTATDIDNIANGLTPESFRSDAGHLNALGYSALNKLISRTYAARGWMED